MRNRSDTYPTSRFSLSIMDDGARGPVVSRALRLARTAPANAIPPPRPEVETTMAAPSKSACPASACPALVRTSSRCDPARRTARRPDPRCRSRETAAPSMPDTATDSYGGTRSSGPGGRGLEAVATPPTPWLAVEGRRRVRVTMPCLACPSWHRGGRQSRDSTGFSPRIPEGKIRRIRGKNPVSSRQSRPAAPHHGSARRSCCPRRSRPPRPAASGHGKPVTPATSRPAVVASPHRFVRRSALHGSGSPTVSSTRTGRAGGDWSGAGRAGSRHRRVSGAGIVV